VPAVTLPEVAIVITVSPAVPVNPFRHHEPGDHVTIRGRRMALGELVDAKIFDPDYVAQLRARVATATPFPHLVDDGWFNPDLLELAGEEFATLASPAWTEWASRHQHIYRSPPKQPLGPASTLYFQLVNSGWFVDFLSTVMGVPHLITDAHLHGGGLHESRTGGRFGIHRDFDRHLHNGLQNELSMMTYLNKDWDPGWGGALELWDKQQKRALHRIAPEFNRSVVLCHGPSSFHGHPLPLATPVGTTRRSLSSYYYSNRTPSDAAARPPQSTDFLIWKPKERLREAVRNVAPPFVWNALKRTFGRQP